jgi:hypothetical protein
MIDTLSYVLVGHFLGDFLLQNDWQAGNKKDKSWNCLVHVMLYCLAIWLSSCLSGRSWPWWAMVITFLTHFAIDRSKFVSWYMGKMGQVQFSKNCGIWANIWVDQAFHFVQLALTAAAVRVMSGS